MDHAHVLEAHAKFFRNDLRKSSVRASAEAGRTGQQRHRAVLVDLHGGVALLLDAGVSGRAVHFAADAPSFADLRALRVGRAVAAPEPLPVQDVDAVLEADFKPVADDRMAGRRDVARPHDVL
ncbi:hypothetical protein D9M72_514820 [compost metagenome]